MSEPVIAGEAEPRDPFQGFLLAVDTTGEFGSIALVQGDRLLEEVPLHSPEGFAHVLFGEIEGLLRRHGVRLDDIGLFASAAGPGSFTGVRIGLTAVKGLAEATCRKVVAVSNLQALAWFGTRPWRAVVMDARRGEVYGAVYDASLRLTQGEIVAPLEKWLSALPPGDVEFITSGVTIVGDRSLSPVIPAPGVLAGAIGQIAALGLSTCPASDPESIDANYVRRSDAELLWKD